MSECSDKLVLLHSLHRLYHNVKRRRTGKTITVIFRPEVIFRNYFYDGWKLRRKQLFWGKHG